jgi:hypothetical protein
MTRRSDLMLEDLTGCTHESETPICDEDGSEILYWVCRCGQRCPDEKKENKDAPPTR